MGDGREQGAPGYGSSGSFGCLHCCSSWEWLPSALQSQSPTLSLWTQLVSFLVMGKDDNELVLSFVIGTVYQLVNTFIWFMSI